MNLKSCLDSKVRKWPDSSRNRFGSPPYARSSNRSLPNRPLFPLLSLLPMNISLAALALTVCSLIPLPAAAAELNFYVGTYTKEGGSKGIYHYRLNPESGAISGGQLAVATVNPSFLAVHPNGKFLYAVGET